MSFLWIEVGALLVAQITSGALALVALGFGERRPLNLTFALFAASEALWFMFAILMRLSIAVGRPDPLLLQLNVAAFGLVGPLLLLFATRLLGGSRWANWLGAAGLAVNAALFVPLFAGSFVSNLRALPGGALTFDVTAGGRAVGALSLALLIAATALLWQARQRNGPVPFWSAALLVVAFVFRLAEIRLPAMPFAYTLSSVLLSFWVARTQLFNPLRETNERLLGEVRERARAERERERLIGELQARNAELERFTYSVSHDLRSPLVTIRGFLAHLERDALAGDQARTRADIRRIDDATGKMDRLLQELLELSRAGRAVGPLEPVPLAQVVQEALDLVAGALRARGVEVAVAPGLPVVRGDRARLATVFQNLLDNAAKSMGDQPRPRVEIGVRHPGADGMPVVFVRDNGVGMDPRHTERVFGLFEKLDPMSEGTGVGLALVRRIVEVHGGRVWAESEGEGRGATFCLTLRTAGNGDAP